MYIQILSPKNVDIIKQILVLRWVLAGYY